MENIDTKIVKYYLSFIIEPIKYGENAIFFWFPGSGMTTVINDLFSDKKLLKDSVGNLFRQLEITLFSGNLANNKNFESLIKESGFNNYYDIKEYCLTQLHKGNEMVFVLSGIDEFPDKEKLEILKLFLKLFAINPRRIHLIFNTINKPWLLKVLNTNHELVALANRLVIMPVIKDKLLENYIKTKAHQYGYEISDVEMIKITKIYGGILRLTKEYLRSKGDISTLELKIKLIWNRLPKSYKEIIENNISQSIPKNKESDFLDLEKFGVLDLQAFSVHNRILEIDSEKIIKSLLTDEENNFYNYLINNKGKLISKDSAVTMLRPEKSSEISLWAIDKAISRFRIKMFKSSIDPASLKTLKGKGYIWQSN